MITTRASMRHVGCFGVSFELEEGLSDLDLGLGGAIEPDLASRVPWRDPVA